MGWLFSCDPNFKRKEQVAELLGQFKEGRVNYPSLVDHSQKGNTLYVVVHIPSRTLAKEMKPRQFVDLSGATLHLEANYRVILVFLLQGPPRGDGGGWGYKSMDESMGPAQVGCPERLLKLSQVNDRHGWREECRKERRRVQARKQWAKTISPGDTLNYRRGPWEFNPETGDYELKIEPVTFERSWSRTFFIGKNKDGERYRYRWDMLAVPDEIEEAA